MELGLFQPEPLFAQDSFANPVQPHEPEQFLPVSDEAGADDYERGDRGPTHEGAGRSSTGEIVGRHRHSAEQHDVRHYGLQLPFQLVAPVGPGNARRRRRNRARGGTRRTNRCPPSRLCGTSQREHLSRSGHRRSPARRTLPPGPARPAGQAQLPGSMRTTPWSRPPAPPPDAPRLRRR